MLLAQVTAMYGHTSSAPAWQGVSPAGGQIPRIAGQALPGRPRWLSSGAYSVFAFVHFILQ